LWLGIHILTQIRLKMSAVSLVGGMAVASDKI